RGAQVLAPYALDGDRAVGDGREPDERTDLDVIGPQGKRRTLERAAALHGERVGPDAAHLGAQSREEAGEVLDVRLAGRVAKRRRAAGRDRGHQRVFGGRDAGPVTATEKDRKSTRLNSSHAEISYADLC